MRPSVIAGPGQATGGEVLPGGKTGARALEEAGCDKRLIGVLERQPPAWEGRTFRGTEGTGGLPSALHRLHACGPGPGRAGPGTGPDPAGPSAAVVLPQPAFPVRSGDFAAGGPGPGHRPGALEHPIADDGSTSIRRSDRAVCPVRPPRFAADPSAPDGGGPDRAAGAVVATPDRRLRHAQPERGDRSVWRPDRSPGGRDGAAAGPGRPGEPIRNLPDDPLGVARPGPFDGPGPLAARRHARACDVLGDDRHLFLVQYQGQVDTETGVPIPRGVRAFQARDGKSVAIPDGTQALTNRRRRARALRPGFGAGRQEAAGAAAVRPGRGQGPVERELPGGLETGGALASDLIGVLQPDGLVTLIDLRALRDGTPWPAPAAGAGPQAPPRKPKRPAAAGRQPGLPGPDRPRQCRGAWSAAGRGRRVLPGRAAVHAGGWPAVCV